MNAIKVMPCLDMKEGRVVKGIHFVELKDAGDPVEKAASVFHYRIFSIGQVKEYLREKGLEVRL